MKSILMSIKPKYVAKILNGEKLIEIRKRFPKDYRGWVYIYCTKDRNALLHKNIADIWWVENKDFRVKNKKLDIKQQPSYNGYIVARFWCDNVDMVNNYHLEEICNLSCLTNDELLKYAGGTYGKVDDLYAIHITKLEIFDKPKELSEFKTLENAKRYKRDLEKAYDDDQEVLDRIHMGIAFEEECANAVQFTEWAEGYYGLNKAPQSWCYVEVEE